MIVIREATARDAESVASLSHELGYEAAAGETRARIAALQADAEHRVFVAESDGAVIGWCHVTIVASVVHDLFAEIRGLVVTESRRGGGIGRMLVAEAERWAAGRSVHDMRVRSNVVREGARRFYEALGYRVTKTSNLFEKRV